MQSRFIQLALTCLLLANTAAAAAAEPAPGKQVAQSLTVKTGEGDATRELKYWLFLPKEYGESDKPRKWPVLLFLHGSGERGDDLELVKKHGPPKNVEANPDFHFITVSPQCPAGERWKPAELVQLVDHVLKIEGADADRCYLTGLSMGGSGTWSLAAAHGDRFAAIIPICGLGDLANVEKVKHLPIWIFVGDEDRPELVQNCRDWEAALHKAGNKAQLTIYEKTGHDSWTATYANPKVYEWLLAQKRK